VTAAGLFGLDVEWLHIEVDAGRVDTVLLVITDMQGRLQGKRMAARYFLDDALAGGVEGCNYMLAVDVDMNTVEGYAISRRCAASRGRTGRYASPVTSCGPTAHRLWHRRGRS